MKTLLFLLLPFMVKAQTYQPYKGDGVKWATLEIRPVNPDTIKVVMLVSDTSSVIGKPDYQDTRPFTMYGYQVKGGFLDMYKQRLNKNIIMWIAYKTK